jgi:hypothetical protein
MRSWIVTFSNTYVHLHTSGPNDTHYYQNDYSASTYHTNENDHISSFVTT